MIDAIHSLIFLLIPFVYFSGYTNGFDLAKNVVFRSLILILLMSYGALFVYRGQWKMQNSRLKHPVTLLFFAIVLLLSLTTLFSATPLVSFFGVYQRQLGLLSFLFIAVLFVSLLQMETRSVHRLGVISFGAAGVISVYALFQRAGINPLFVDFNDKIFDGRVYSTLGNPDFLAQFIAPVFPLGLAIFVEQKRKIYKIFTGILLIGIIAALLFTQSRASVLGLTVGMIIFGVVSILFHSGFRKKAIKIFVSGLAILVTISGITLFLLPSLGIQRFNLEATSLRSVYSRFSIWGSAVELIADHPLLGTGIDTFSLHFSKYAHANFFTHEEALNITADREHNEILQLGVWGGIPAIVIYILLAYNSLKFLFLKGSKFSIFERSLFIGLIVYLIQNQFTFSSLTHYILWTFFLASIVVTTSQKNRVAQSTITIKYPKGHTWLYIPFSILILVIWNFTVLLPLRADTAYISALYGSQSQEEVVQHLRDAVSFFPYSSLLYFELMKKSPEDALTSLESMKKIEGETPDILVWEGSLMIKEDFDRAIDYYLNALVQNSTYPPFLRAVGDAYFLHGECKKSIDYYEQFLRYAPPFWRWKFDLKSRPASEQRTYRIFFTKNETDFPNIFKHIVDCSLKLGNASKAQYYSQFLAP